MKSAGQLFCRMSLLLDLSNIFHDESEVMHLWQAHHGSDAASFSVHDIGGVGGVTLICRIIDDVNLDDVVKVVSDRFLHSQVTFFPL